MSDQQPPTTPLLVIPPSVLLFIALAGVLVSLFIVFTQGTLSIVGVGALAVSLISVVVWGITNPEQLRQALSGRTLSYGGTAVVFVAILGIILVLAYILIRNVGLRADFSEGDNFSLNEQSRSIIQTISSDPTSPDLLITGFLGTAQAGQRDRINILLEDIQRTSNNRIQYQFIDPDRDPLTLRAYEGQAGSFFITPYDEAGQPDLTKKEAVNFVNQQELLNGLISASATGNFKAYFVAVDSGLSIDDAGSFGAQVFAEELRTRYKWQIEEISLLQIGNAVTLNDPSADGEALVIAGGITPLPESEVTRITDYLDAGGAVLLFADLNPNGGDSLATTPALSDYLAQNYGFRVTNQLIVDPANPFPSSSLDFVVTDFTPSEGFMNFGTSEGVLLSNPVALMLEPIVPEGVTLTPLAQTSPRSYTKQGIDFTQQQSETILQQTADDPTGAFLVGLIAENATTGGKIAVITSPSLLFNLYRQYETVGLRNVEAVRKALFRIADYDNFAASLASLPPVATAQETPILADEITLSTINFITVIAMPFSVLGLGVLVWWLRRERVQV